MYRTLAFFPTPYPDEDFRSIVYRYHIRVGYKNFFSTCLDLYGRKLNYNLPIPINMIPLTSKLPIDCGINMENLLNHNTFWPLLRIYINASNYKKSIQSIQYGRNTIGANQYLVHSGILSYQIRYCSKCLKEDFEKYGECFTHLCHQINDIVVCPIHQTRLITQCPVCNIKLSNEDGTSLLVTPYCSNGHSLSDVHTKKCNNIAQMQLYHDVQIICENSNRLTLKEILLRYRLASIRKGYTGMNGFLYKEKLNNDILTAIATNSNKITDLLDYSEISRILSNPMYFNFNNIYFHSLSFFIFLMYFFYGSVGELLHSNLFLTDEIEEVFRGVYRNTISEYIQTHTILSNLLSSFDEVAVTD